MVLSLGEVPRCDVTPHIGEEQAQKIPRRKMCSNPMLENAIYYIYYSLMEEIYSFHKMEKTYSFHKMITII